LEAHLSAEHTQQFTDAEQWLDPTYQKAVKHFSRTWRGVYDAAISVKEREGVPTVGSCIDRRAHEAFTKRHSENNLCAPMCFSCARVLPYDQYYVDCVSNEETSQQPTIQWRKVMEQDRFCNMTKNETQAAIGMDSYIKEYGQSPDLTTSTAQKELSAWTLSVPFEAGSVDILCCPEDRKCTNDPDNKEGIASSSHALCKDCELPVCKDCWQALSKAHKRPKLSLANDLWTGYIPAIIYEENCTYMELLAASLCSPTLMSIQYEFYKKPIDVRQENVHMQEHRTGARGNFTGADL
jgi:hypothetical protein